jgi:hypothetical chaperone protein
MTGETVSRASAVQSAHEGMRLDGLRDRNPARSLGIGFDFGTSNSAVAVYDGRQISIVRLETSKPIMPSATYIDRAFAAETGEQAIRTYIESNQGRRVEFSAEVLGEARTSTGQIDQGSGLPGAANAETIYGREINDAGLPGRLFHGIKRLLGKDDAERIAVFGRPYRLVALITPILLRMRQAA